jgi:hypothetical protein
MSMTKSLLVFNVIPLTNVSGTQVITSQAIDMTGLQQLAVQAIPSSGVNGGLAIYGSLDYNKSANIGTWVELIEAIPPAGAGVSSIADCLSQNPPVVFQTACPWIQLRWSNTGGTGTISVWFAGKNT